MAADTQKIAGMVADRAAEILTPMEAEMEFKRWPHDLRAIMWDAIATMAAGMASASRKEPKS